MAMGSNSCFPFLFYIHDMKAKAILGLILLVAACACAQPDTAVAGARLHGLVLDKANNKPVQGAIVVITKDTFADSTLSDSLGEYRISAIHPENT
jgi:hypothetical protein